MAETTTVQSTGTLPAPARSPFLLRHWLFTLALVAGLAIRVLTQIAYRPGLELFGDSYAYLHAAQIMKPDTWHPFGYSLFLKVFSITGRLWTVVVAQHLLGLAMAVALYALMIRWGTRPWVAALGTLPVLLDGYQLDSEHFVLSETLVEVLLVAGLVVLAWRGRPQALDGGLAGVLLAGACLTRSAALPLLAVAVLYLLLRLRWRAAIACVVCAAIPLVGYAAWFNSQYGTFGMQRFSGIFLYGRVAPIAVCDYPVPADEKRLCETSDPATRQGAEFYVWRAKSPLRQLRISDNDELDRIGRSFAKRVILHQPVDYARIVLRDTFHYFKPGRPSGSDDPYEIRWRFPGRGPHPDLYHVQVANAGFPGEATHPHTSWPVAKVVRAYQKVVYTQGPILLVALIGAAFAGLALFGRRVGDRQLRWIAAVFGATGLLLALGPSLTTGFSYRYGIPLIVTLPPAGAVALEVGLRALAARRVSSGPEAPRP
ncbi:MAG TPA: hypothetical protein VHC49_10475 [Mycobacteriales bacterium]|nr:hypothetical protein [Mycobacteriales bacterium]